MNKDELITALAEKSKVTKALSKTFLDNFLDVVVHTLAKGETIGLMGYFSLSTIDRKATKGRNPQTGEEIIIPARKQVKFSAGKSLKDAVNNKKTAAKKSKPDDKKKKKK